MSSYLFEVQEYLDGSLPKAFLSILNQIHSTIEKKLELLINDEDNKDKEVNPLRRVRKMMSSGKKVRIISKVQMEYNKDER